MDNRIIYEPSSRLRGIARDMLKNNWDKMFFGMLIYFALTTAVQTILDAFFTFVSYVQLYNGRYFPIEFSYVGDLYSLLISGPMLVGLAMFMLAFFRTKEIQYGHILEGFKTFGKCFVLYLLYVVKISLWSLLFVVPGIIAIFRYSMCFYLRVDHPDWTASQCINESTRLMKGNKGKLFCLRLSFFGWYILAVLPYATLTTFVEEGHGFLFLVGLILAHIPMVIIDIYVKMSEISFYEIMVGNLVLFNPTLGPEQPAWEHPTEGYQANAGQSQEASDGDAGDEK